MGPRAHIAAQKSEAHASKGDERARIRPKTCTILLNHSNAFLFPQKKSLKRKASKAKKRTDIRMVWTKRLLSQLENTLKERKRSDTVARRTKDTVLGQLQLSDVYPVGVTQIRKKNLARFFNVAAKAAGLMAAFRSCSASTRSKSRLAPA